MRQIAICCYVAFICFEICAVPEKTLRFPGSGTTTFETDGKTLVAGTGWTRECGATVWDVSDPTAMKHIADVRARGYTTDRPVFVGNRVYMPLWFGAMCIDISKPAEAKIESLIDFDFPNHTCDWFVCDGTNLTFCTRNGSRTYDISNPAVPAVFKSASTNVTEHLKAEKDARLKYLPQSVRGSARFVGDYAYCYDRGRSSYRIFHVDGTNAVQTCERFMLHSLSSVAVLGAKAYINAAPPPMTQGILTLDLQRNGIVDFESDAIFRPAPPRGTDTFTMLMQSVGSIVPLDGHWLLADDGAVKIDANGVPSFIGERELPVCNYAIDVMTASPGKRVLLAQSSQVKLIDVSNPAEIKTVAIWKADEMTHATGVALAGDDCWAVTQERQGPGKGFLTYAPPESTLRKFRIDGTQLVETASCKLPTSVSCVYANDGVIYVSGLGRKETHASISVVDGKDMKVIAVRKDLCEGSSYKIKRFDDRILFIDCLVGIKELDYSDPRNPKVSGVWRKSGGSNPAYDDFTVADADQRILPANKRLYALSHSSLDFYDLNNPESPDNLVWDSPRYEMNFGAVEKNRIDLGNGLEALAFGEAGLILYKDGKYLSELPATENGLCPVFASSVKLSPENRFPALIVEDHIENRQVTIDISDPKTPKIVAEKTNE